MSWYNLPVEVHLMILSFLAASEHAQGASLTDYALVSRQWQPVFERLTFSRASVKPSGLTPFKTAFQHVHRHRRRYLERLTLIVDFHDTYKDKDGKDGHKEHHHNGHHHRHHDIRRDVSTIVALCQDAGHPDADDRHVRRRLARDNQAFTSCLTRLLSLLSTWDPQESTRGGITLEILAVSESRWQRTARWLRSFHKPDTVDLQNPGSDAVFPAPLSWFTWELSLAAAENDFGFSLDLDIPGFLLPTVHVITGLAILRDSVRAVHPATVTALLRSLPAVARLDWEARRRFPPLVETEFQVRLAHALPTWPESLREVRLHRVGRFCPEESLMNLRDYPFMPLAPALAACASRGLEHLSVSYRIDMPGFFFNDDTQWTQLRALTLKSRRPIIEGLPSTRHAVEAIAEAVSRMPSLEWLLVYHSKNTTAAAFRYERRLRRVVISALSSRPFDLGESCRTAWERVSEPLEVEWRWVAIRPLEVVKQNVQIILNSNISDR